MTTKDYEELKKMIDRTQKDLDVLKSMIVQSIKSDEFIVGKTGDEGVIEFLQTHFSLEDVELSEEYYYTSLPLCLIDAIFSIGVTYTSTQNVVKRYCKKYELKRIRKSNNEKETHTLSDLIRNIEEYDISEARYERYASEVLCNTQRTSSVNGILKLQAVYECANIFVENGINTIADFNKLYNDNIGKKYCSVKGQSSGISLSYLKMLCGSTDTIKPDRHILRFLNEFYEEEIDVENAKNKMESIVKRLNQNYKKLNMRELDYIIWDFMKNK